MYEPQHLNCRLHLIIEYQQVAPEDLHSAPSKIQEECKDEMVVIHIPPSNREYIFDGVTLPLKSSSSYTHYSVHLVAPKAIVSNDKKKTALNSIVRRIKTWEELTTMLKIVLNLAGIILAIFGFFM
ncbi:hypothetical protein ACEYW6_10445 [Nostoc sp. UIC 10607]|uniref:hypothetical protein n=1 Tax=Nostoc sp. UIC 10607 TaxID=3045935 RepID=UPI0039A1E514